MHVESVVISFSRLTLSANRSAAIEWALPTEFACYANFSRICFFSPDGNAPIVAVHVFRRCAKPPTTSWKNTRVSHTVRAARLHACKPAHAKEASMAHTTLHSLANEFKIRSASLPTSEQYKLFLELLDRVFSAGYTSMQFASALRASE